AAFPPLPNPRAGVGLCDLRLLQGKNRPDRSGCYVTGSRLPIFGIIPTSIFPSPREPREVAMRFLKTLTFLMLATGLVFVLPAWAQQKSVGPSGAGPRPNAVRPYVACAAAMPALPPRAQQKPFTQEQVSNMVRDGFGDESGAKLIEQRGIDFTPSEDFLQSVKAAGASEAFLNALRAARPIPRTN